MIDKCSIILQPWSLDFFRHAAKILVSVYYSHVFQLWSIDAFLLKILYLAVIVWFLLVISNKDGGSFYIISSCYKQWSSSEVVLPLFLPRMGF